MDLAQLQLEVDRLHRQLHIDTSQIVDVYAAIRQLGVWLAFKPLDKLFGAYLNPTGTTPGILVNSNHPLQLQRFTAAHELGHYWLGHAPSADSAIGTSTADVWFNQLDDREKDADTFAALFLMPETLLKRVATRLGIDVLAVNSVTHEQVLALSTNLGTSYTSTLNRLRAIGSINASYQRYLAEPKPQEIKQRVGAFKPDILIQEALRERKPTWNDIIVVDQTSNSGTICVRTNQVLQIILDTLDTSGYIWELANVPEGVDRLWNTQITSPPGVFGGGIRHIFTLWNLRPGSYLFTFAERLAWNPMETGNSFSIRVFVEQYRVGIDLLQVAS